MTGNDLTVARFGGAVLLTFALTACATPKQDEAGVSSEAATSAPSSASGAEPAASGDSVVTPATSSGSTAKPAATPTRGSAAVRAPVKTATGTKTTVTKTDPGPDRDSAFGPKYTIDANGNVVPIRKK